MVFMFTSQKFGSGIIWSEVGNGRRDYPLTMSNLRMAIRQRLGCSNPHISISLDFQTATTFSMTVFGKTI